MPWRWIEESRKPWEHKNGSTAPDGHELYMALGIGCLQRIAASLETLVEMKENSERESQREAHKKRWEAFKPYFDCERQASERAIERLFAEKKVGLQIKHDVNYWLQRFSPKSPFFYYGDSPIDLDVASKWQHDSVAYWDGIKELPESIAKPNTKKQAKYAEWLASTKAHLNGKAS